MLIVKVFHYTHTPQAGAAELSCYSTPLLVVELGFHNCQTFVAYPPSLTRGADGQEQH